MPDTTTDRLAEIQARAEAAAEGPWYVEAHQPTLTRRVVSDDHMLDANLGYLGNRNQAEAEFIAHAREDVPWLLREVLALQSELAAATSQLERLDGELVRLRDENREYERGLGLNEEAA